MPIGTQVFAEDQETEVLQPIWTSHAKRVTLLRGGDGGFNGFNADALGRLPTRKAAARRRQSWPGEERWVWLRLKLIADAGLIGLPNAGKSTFLAATTAARPKIADYPFTTLHPQLGVIRLSMSEEFVLADIPGLRSRGP